MKRILKAGIVGTAISMLFTGCGSSSLVSGSGGGYQEIKWKVVETQETKENLGSTALKEGETLPVKEMPDFYEEQSEEKLADTEILAAFKIKEGHSEDTRDIELFEVGALLNDGTFIYCYTTKLGSLNEDADRDDRPIVHCVAAYNYKTKQFKVIHENAFTRDISNTGEDSESFYMQMCNSDGAGNIFVYDCGFGYLYDSTGEKRFETSIEPFVRKHFTGHSVVATQALMEGGDRIYIDLVIEKEEIVSVDETMDEDEVSEEEADKEAEELDKEFDEKSLEIVLVYDFQNYTSSIDQTNQMLDMQAAGWTSLGLSFSGDVGEEPPIEEHWQIAADTFPNQWGPAYLYDLKSWSEDELAEYGIADTYISGTPVFQWTGEKEFEYREGGYVPTFVPKKEKYQPFTDLKSNTTLENVFVLIDGRYYELFGNTGNDLGEGDYYSVSFNRTFTRKDEITKEDGTTETQDTSVTQTISKNRKRDTYPNNSYLEGYWIMDNCDSVFDIVDEDVFCIVGVSEDDKEYDEISWLKPDGNMSPICRVESDTMIDIFKDNGSLYMAVSYEDWTSIEKINLDTKVMEGSFGIAADEISNVIETVDYKGTEVDPKYHEEYNRMSSEDKKETLGQNAGTYLDSKNILHVKLGNTQKELLQKIEDYKLAEIKMNHKDNTLENIKQLVEYIDAEKISDIGNEGYLLTSFADGLLYFDKETRKTISLDDGTWYGTWRFDDKFVSVGFSSTNSSYEALDIAHSGVYEYSLDDLYKSALETIVESTEQAFTYLEKEESEGSKKMREELEEKRKDEDVVFVTPDEDGWKDNTPGGELKSIEEKRQQEIEKESKAREEAGEWDPVDEYFYGDERLESKNYLP